MTENRQLILSQSKTTLVKTPPPSDASLASTASESRASKNGTQSSTARLTDDSAIQLNDCISVEKTSDDDNYSINVPSFVRLFVIRRILCEYIDNYNKANSDLKYNNTKKDSNSDSNCKINNVNKEEEKRNETEKDKEKEKDRKIQQAHHYGWNIVNHKKQPQPYYNHLNSRSGTQRKNIRIRENEMRDHGTLIQDLVNGLDVQIKTTAKDILTQLLNHGLKMYMKTFYNETKQANVIEEIFDKILLKRFEKEYDELITYKTDKLKYQDLVFNSNDLMCAIFEYLEWGKDFDEDLFECSLVNSCWFYHSWNINSVYKINLNQLVYQTLKYKINEENSNNVIRLWQRLIHAKCIYFDGSFYFSKYTAVETRLLLNKLSMLTKIDKVDIVTPSRQANVWTEMTKAIMKGCNERMKYCQLCIRGARDRIFGKNLHENEILLLRLPNAQYIDIGDSYFYRIWTNKCVQLKLRLSHFPSRIPKNLYQFFIDNCDCSNINNLTLDNNSFGDKPVNESILKNFAEKFINLKRLKIIFVCWMFPTDSNSNANIFVFCKYLTTIRTKKNNNNNIHVELELTPMLSDAGYSTLSNRIDEYNLKIEKLIITKFKKIKNTHTIQFIQKRDGHGLKHLVIKDRLIFDNMTKFVKKISFESITVLEVDAIDVKSYDGISLNQVNDFLGLNIIIEKKLVVIINIAVDHSNDDNSTILLLYKKLCKMVWKLCIKQIAFDIKIWFRNVQNKSTFNPCLFMVHSSFFQNEKILQQYNKPRCDRYSDLCSPRDKLYTYLYVSQTEYKSILFSITNVTYL